MIKVVDSVVTYTSQYDDKGNVLSIRTDKNSDGNIEELLENNWERIKKSIGITPVIHYLLF